MADKIKWLAAVAIFAVAIVAFYYFEEQQMLFRVLGLLAIAGVAVAIALQTQSGAAALAAGRGALIEVRKVVWPSRKETTQTTLLVMVMVLVVGLILWGFDSVLAWAIRLLTGQGS